MPCFEALDQPETVYRRTRYELVPFDRITVRWTQSETVLVGRACTHEHVP